MRLITFRHAGRVRPGALTPGGDVYDLGGLRPSDQADPISTIAELLSRPAPQLQHLATLIAEATESARLISAAEIDWLPPLGADTLVVATSGNYLSHIAEMGMPPPARTHGFIVSPNSLVGHGAAIRLPRGHDTMVDWEGELALVLARSCYRATPAEAAAAIGGYTIFNDISARDWTPKMSSLDPREAVAAWRNNILFKQFPTFGPLGPAVVTPDEITDVDKLFLTTRINGEVMQRDAVTAMQFSFGEIISQLSEVYAFAAGDVVTTGTPAGVGFARQPQRFLRPGDEVVVEVDGIGALRNTVTAD